MKSEGLGSLVPSERSGRPMGCEPTNRLIQLNESRSRDLARGSGFLVLWGGPIALLLIGSALGDTGTWTLRDAGILWVIGTAWLGGACLANAWRCSRAHCWIDGTFLPALAVAELLTVLGVVTVAWSTWSAVFWAIIIGGFVVEWIAGPYLARDRHGARA